MSPQPLLSHCKLLALCLATLLAGTSTAITASGQDEAKSGDQQDARPLKEQLSAFAPYAGTWEIDTEWAGGGKLWARNTYSIGMNGNFFQALTWTKNENGKVYQRYQTIWRWNVEKEVIEAYGFTYDGSVTISESELDTTDPKRPIIRSQWRPDENSQFIKQEVQISEDGNSYEWRVWGSPDKKEWTKMMDGVYKRVKG